MDIHQNAALTPRGRARLVRRVVDHGWSYRATARAFGVDTRTVRRWVGRYRGGGARALRHRRTRPYRPRTNGKAERFIQTALREWAYAFAYTSSGQRAAHLPRWLHDYNWHRRHGSPNARTPISVLGLPEDNLVRLHS